LPLQRGLHYVSSAPTRSRASTTYLVHVLSTKNSSYQFGISFTRSASGKEGTAPVDDLAKQLDRLEEMMCSLTGTVHDIRQQQQ
jgi:hypothetical protein